MGDLIVGKVTAAATSAIVVTAALLLSAVPAGANTTVSVSGDNVTLTVHIDCAGCAGRTGPDGSPLAEYWGRTAEQAWNSAFETHQYCSRYQFHLAVKIRAEGQDFKAKPGDDLVQVAQPGPDVLANTGWEGATEHNPSGDPGQRTPDGTRYYETDADGVMGADATPTVIDHEFGHLLGLGDDRDKNGNALPGRGGTLMIGGARLSNDSLVTPDTPLRIDQALIDRIGKQLETLGKIDKCKKQSWHGTLHVDATIGRAPQAGPCMASYTADVTLAVEDKGTSGQASIRPGGSNSCGPPATAATVPLSARHSASGFAIDTGQLTPNAPATVQVKESRQHTAHGTVTTSEPGLPAGREVTYNVIIDLQCANCGTRVG